MALAALEDRLALVTPADIRRVAGAYLRLDNMTAVVTLPLLPKLVSSVPSDR